MLDDVLGNYLDTLTEREFDAPFLAMLRARGYHDIHFLHGAFEFGKDFIAKVEDKGETHQVSFQTKGGNIGISDWREARGQIDEMRTNNLAHPNFNTELPRRTVFVTTGRLAGAAPVSAQEYERHLEQLGEGGFEVWDRETIVDDLANHPELGLAGKVDEELMRMLADVASGSASHATLEVWSRAWAHGDTRTLWRGALSVAIVGARCRQANRLDLAGLAALLLVRAAMARLIDEPDEDAESLSAVGGRLFERYGEELFERCRDRAEDSDLYLGSGELAIWVTYPARVMRVTEVLALNALRRRLHDPVEAGPLEDCVLRIVSSQPGAAHPLSDWWAASLVPIGLVLGLRDQDMFGRWVTDVVRWVANHYEGGLGLAGLGASTREEVEYVAGSALEHVNVEPRKTSAIATAILDLTSVFERADLYELAVNEFLAVEVLPDVVEVGDSLDQTMREGETVTRQVNWAHDESWTPSNDWKTAAHHRLSPDPYALAATHTWEHLVLVSVLRDRMFATTQRLIAAGRP